jgi:hypothetical protein
LLLGFFKVWVWVWVLGVIAWVWVWGLGAWGFLLLGQLYKIDKNHYFHPKLIETIIFTQK